MNNSLLNYYRKLLYNEPHPDFIIKYLSAPSLNRLKNIGYFCGMDYASKNVYNFSEYISRYTHSLNVAILTYNLTHNQKETLAGLFHDIATPCFSHVIDYMNKDYETQESTEEYTKRVLLQDKYLLNCLKEDKINIEEVANFKNYHIVDNERPKLCADRLDGVVLNSIGWTKNITQEEIKNILSDIKIYLNEENTPEIGFTNEIIAKRVVELSKKIDLYCHSKEDNYMMNLLSEITKIAINNGDIEYDDLFTLTEPEIFRILENSKNNEITKLLHIFYHIKKEEIPEINLPKIKVRNLNPIVKGKRLN